MNPRSKRYVPTHFRRFFLPRSLMQSSIHESNSPSNRYSGAALAHLSKLALWFLPPARAGVARSSRSRRGSVFTTRFVRLLLRSVSFWSVLRTSRRLHCIFFLSREMICSGLPPPPKKVLGGSKTEEFIFQKVGSKPTTWGGKVRGCRRHRIKMPPSRGQQGIRRGNGLLPRVTPSR